MLFGASPTTLSIYCLLADGTTKKPSAKAENPTKTDPKLDKTYFYQKILLKTDSIYKYKGDTEIRIPSDTINSIIVIKLNLEKSIPNISSMVYFDKYTAELLKIKALRIFQQWR